MSASAAVEPVRALTRRSSARFVSPSPMSDTSCANQTSRYSRIRRTSREDRSRGVTAGSVIGGVLLVVLDGVQRDEESERRGLRRCVVLAELVDELLHPVPELRRTSRGETRASALDEAASLIVLGPQEPLAERLLDLVAGTVEHAREHRVRRSDRLRVGATEERAVKTEAELRGPVARLDDPLHDARPGDGDQ